MFFAAVNAPYTKAGVSLLRKRETSAIIFVRPGEAYRLRMQQRFSPVLAKEGYL